MNTVHKIENWGNTHHPVVLDPIRVILGIFLVIKGAAFINNNYTLHSIIANQNFIPAPESVLMGIVYFVAFAHLLGGTLIALGVVTRIASLIQIPIMIGAVVFTTSVQVPDATNIWVSLVVLALLVVFSIVGAGKLSIEKIMANQKTIFS